MIVTSLSALLSSHNMFTIKIILFPVKVSWPRGTYGLVKPKAGCPSNNWQEGSRYFHTEYGNAVSEGHHLYNIGIACFQKYALIN